MKDRGKNQLQECYQLKKPLDILSECQLRLVNDELLVTEEWKIEDDIQAIK